jgi:hypothetical protein
VQARATNRATVRRRQQQAMRRAIEVLDHFEGLTDL